MSKLSVIWDRPSLTDILVSEYNEIATGLTLVPIEQPFAAIVMQNLENQIFDYLNLELLFPTDLALFRLENLIKRFCYDLVIDFRAYVQSQDDKAGALINDLVIKPVDIAKETIKERVYNYSRINNAESLFNFMAAKKRFLTNFKQELLRMLQVTYGY